MNNSRISINSLEMEEKIDLTPMLNRMETELIEIIDALEHISGSKYWKVLEQKILNKDFESLQKRLRNEKNPTEVYRLQGRLNQAEKLDLTRELQARKAELQGIRSRKNAV